MIHTLVKLDLLKSLPSQVYQSGKSKALRVNHPSNEAPIC